MPPVLPPGRQVELPGRGTTFIREVGATTRELAGPTVVLLHGWTATADLNWAGCYDALAERHHVVAVDHRGHGRGIRSKAAFQLEDCADDVAALAEVLGLRRIVAVGYSMGGPIAMLVAKRHPSITVGMVLCATTAHFGTSQRFRYSMSGLAMAFELAPPALRSALMTRLVATRVQGRATGDDWMATEYALADPAALLQAGRALSDFDATPWIDSLGVPASVVITTDDQIVSPGKQELLASSIPGAQAVRIEGDHRVCVSDAPRFAAALLDAISLLGP